MIRNSPDLYPINPLAFLPDNQILSMLADKSREDDGDTRKSFLQANITLGELFNINSNNKFKFDDFGRQNTTLWNINMVI